MMELVNATKPRLDYIDVAKGIGILLMVLGHIVTIGSGVYNYIYSFHMPLFFIISGILLFYNDRWKDDDLSFTIKRKAKRLLWPYLVFSIIWLVLYAVIKPEMWSYYFSLFITFNGIDTLWFLSTLFFAEIIFIILMKRCNFKLRVFFIGLMVILSGIYSLFLNSGVDENIIILLICRPLLACVFLFIGYYFIKLKSRVSFNNWVILITGLISIGVDLYLSGFCNVDFHHLIMSNLLIFYIDAILGSYGIIAVSYVILKKFSLLKFYGKNSLIVFVTQTFILQFFMKLSIDFWPDWILFILAITLSAIGILIINKYLRFLINYDVFKDLIFRCKVILNI